MGDMRRHNVYEHELAALEYYIKLLADTKDNGSKACQLLEIKKSIENIRRTDPGPLSRGTHITVEKISDAVFYGVKERFEYYEHVEVQRISVREIMVSIRLKDGPLDFYNIQIKHTR